MGTNISKFITKRMPWNGEMTELNHLGAALAAQPYKFEGPMTRIFASKTIFDNPFLKMNIGREKTITSNEWEWEIKGADRKPLTLIEHIGSENGKYGQTITLRFDEDYWVEGDVVTPGDQFQNKQCRIMRNPYRSGNGWIYELQLVTNDQTEYVDAEYLNPGSRWMKLYSTYGEAATRGGSMQFSGGMAMRDHLGKIRKQYKVTDYATEEVLAVKMIDANGGSHSKWVSYAEVEFNKEWQREIELACWYNKDGYIIGENGRKVDSFAGIIQKIYNDGWKYPYNVLTAKTIEEFIMDIYFGRTNPNSSERKLTAWTGEVGMIKFSHLIQSEYGKNGWLVVNDQFNPVQKTTSPYHSNAYSYGYQFTEYKMANGASLTLIHNPLFDNPDYNQEVDPITGYPKSSQMFLFMDLAPVGKSKSNVEMVVKKDGFKFWYVEGGISPYGPKHGGTAAHSGEWYEMHFSKEFGIHIEDPTRTGVMYMQ